MHSERYCYIGSIDELRRHVVEVVYSTILKNYIEEL